MCTCRRARPYRAATHLSFARSFVCEFLGAQFAHSCLQTRMSNADWLRATRSSEWVAISTSAVALVVTRLPFARSCRSQPFARITF